MLAFDLFESLGRRGVALLDHLVHRLIVQVVDRLFDIGVLVARRRRQQAKGSTRPNQATEKGTTDASAKPNKP